MADQKKTPPRDQKELDNIRSLFEKGLNEAAKDPEKMEQIRRDKERLIKPWEDYLKGWKKSDKKDDEKKDEKEPKDKNPKDKNA